MAAKKPGVVKARVMKLIKDLESGKHKQARGMLARRIPGSKKFAFCCLGRACEVALANGCEVKVKDTTRNRIYSDMSSTLPPEVQEWYGFRKHDPVIGGEPATAQNDIRRRSFPEIAKMFREELKKGTL